MPAKDDSFKLNQFGGMLPAWDPTLLPQNQAVNSLNGYLFSGALDSWRVPKLLHTTSLVNPGYVYRLPHKSAAISNATLVFSGNVSEGNTVTLGEEVYKFTATVKSAYDVLIGVDEPHSAANLFAAITFDNGAGTNAGTLYGTGTVANPAIDQSVTILNPVTKNTLLDTAPCSIKVLAPGIGAAYNSTLVGSTGANLAWQYNGAATTSLLGGANVTLSTDITGPSVWLEFADPDTDVVRSPVVDDQFERYYVASASAAPVYNTRDRIEAGSAPWLLGVPAPGCSPGVEVAGGGSAATIGFATSTSSNAGAPGANTIYLIPVTPQGAMILNDIAVVAASADAACVVTGVLYNDLNGTPHQLLNVGQPVKGVSAGQTVTSAFINPTGLLMNTQYWIGVMISTNAAFQFADDTGASGVVSLNTFTNGAPSAIENLKTGFGELQLWGDLTTSSVLDARAYVYTYVTEYGEESPPSPATVVTGWANGTWTVTLFTPPPDQMGVTRNITDINIYRSVTATAGATTYFFVATVPVKTPTYTDIITDDVAVTNNQLQSQLWSPPPEGLQGFVVGPNGMMAAWQGNEIWFCEPYRPHAWPASYVQTTEYPIVGLGITGTAVVAATTGAPYVTVGVSPSQMSAVKVQHSEPCHSRKSVLGNTDGVYYCSRNGLILVDSYGNVKNVTETWITREKWQQLTPQKNVVGVFLSTMYFAFQRTTNAGADGQGVNGFTVELNAADATSFSIYPQPGYHRQGFQLLSNQLANAIAMVEIDPWSAVCLVVSGNGVYQYDFTDPAPTLSVVDWTSKQFQQRYKQNFAAMRIKFRVPPGTPAQNPVRMENATDDPVWLAPLPQDRYGYILVYTDNMLITAREIRTPQEILRILSGMKHETWQWRIITRVEIVNVQIGTSIKALADV